VPFAGKIPFLALLADVVRVAHPRTRIVRCPKPADVELALGCDPSFLGSLQVVLLLPLGHVHHPLASVLVEGTVGPAGT
jgi:hypothetical protein